jgi:hypothetical protein
MDDFISEGSFGKLVDAFPDAGRKTGVRWRKMAVATEEGRPAQVGKVDFSNKDTGGLSNEYFVNPTVRQIFWELNSSTFLKFLEKLTGIKNLLPDPHLQGGGIHQIERGGMLRVHADFNYHPVFKLDRRLNLLLYLNDPWPEEWGGHLQLWSKDMSHCEQKVLPVARRCVIFNTLSDSWHGHPDPLTCPEDVRRKSIAMYYYTNGRPSAERHKPHKTKWQSMPGEYIPMKTRILRKLGLKPSDASRPFKPRS